MIGGSQLIPLDIRVIASTNKDLQKQMETGNFREDLYFRLNVLSIHIPPLRERKSDIPLLIDFYIREFCRENGVKTKEVSPEAMTLIMDYSWPGNIRELRNFVEKAIVLVESLRIEFCDVQRMLEGEAKRKVGMDIPEMELKDARQLFEREYIKKILKRNQGNITRTSEKLGIPRTYLYRKMKNLNIPLQE